MRIVVALPLLLATLVALVSCSGTNKASTLAATDKLVTGSVAQSVRPDGVAPEDVEIIKSRVSSATAFSKPLEWRNEATGASGAIMAIETYRGRHGQPCRSFRTSIANFFGVSLFDGETCEVSRRSWILSWLKRSD